MSATLNLYEEDNLLKVFEEIHNFIYANDGLSTHNAFEEFIKILFLKLLDEKNNLKLFFITDNEYKNNDKEFIKRINKLLDFVKNKYGEIFTKDEKLFISNNSLFFIVKKMQNIDFSNSTSDVKGLAFQKFLSSQSKGGRGQFFTPQEVINFCIEMIQPSIDKKIIDPTCGSGGFLFSSLKYLEKQKYELKNFKYEKLFGIDINKEVIKIAKLKALLEEVNLDNFINLNSIEDINSIYSKYKINDKDNLFDIVLTNPPFGTQGKITDKNTLKQYELGYKWIKNGNEFIKTDKLLNSQVPDVLFIERCLQLLKDNGKLAIVLPNGILENMSLAYVRYFLKTNCKITAIIKLPDDTFIPYGTGVKTSLLFLEKKQAEQQNDYQIFFSKITKLGYKGNKNGTPMYKKDDKGNFIYINGTKILDEDYSQVLNDYKQFQQGNFKPNDNSFIITSKEIDNRFDYNFYSPILRKPISYLKNINAVKLYEIVDIIKEKSTILKQDLEVEYIELSDINTYSYEIINSTILHTSNLPSRASYQIQTGDIITAVAGNSIGSKKHATAYVTNEYNNAICTNGFRVLRNAKINPYYLLYFMKTDYFLNQIMLYRTGTAIPNISDNDFKNILIEIPTQSKIDELSSKIERIFYLKKESNNILKLLKIA
jgi:type I restriction enzyme M protein